jgi:hypothetical protein
LVARDIDPRLVVEAEKVVVLVDEDEPELSDVAILDKVGGNVALKSVAALLNDVAVLEVDCGNEQTPISS